MFILAVMVNRIVYGNHDKVYITRAKAESALKVMIRNGSLHKDYKVYEIVGLKEVI